MVGLLSHSLTKFNWPKDPVHVSACGKENSMPDKYSNNRDVKEAPNNKSTTLPEISEEQRLPAMYFAMAVRNAEENGSVTYALVTLYRFLAR